jgi:hypothetical protein
VLIFAGSLSGAYARPDPVSWKKAEELSQKIGAPVAEMEEPERKAALDTFARLRAERERLENEERALVIGLTQNRDALKGQAAELAQHRSDVQAWDARTQDYNARCRRTFTNSADVARCDAEAAKLAADRNALEARQAHLAKRSAEFDGRQKELVARATELESGFAAWTKSVSAQFNEPVEAALARVSETLRMTVKSFIRVVDLASLSAEHRPRAEQQFAWLTNKNFSENPQTPDPGGNDFRLWSQVTAIVACRGDTIVSWKTSILAHRGGRELGILDAETTVLEPLEVSPARQGTSPIKALSIKYAIKGRPNELALKSFLYVRPRACDDIWHRVAATVSCRAGKAQVDEKISGSRFPSHRAWTNGNAKTTIDQGPFAGLWECSPTLPGLIR